MLQKPTPNCTGTAFPRLSQPGRFATHHEKNEKIRVTAITDPCCMPASSPTGSSHCSCMATDGSAPSAIPASQRPMHLPRSVCQRCKVPSGTCSFPTSAIYHSHLPVPITALPTALAAHSPEQMLVASPCHSLLTGPDCLATEEKRQSSISTSAWLRTHLAWQDSVVQGVNEANAQALLPMSSYLSGTLASLEMP